MLAPILIRTHHRCLPGTWIAGSNAQTLLMLEIRRETQTFMKYHWDIYVFFKKLGQNVY